VYLKFFDITVDMRFNEDDPFETSFRNVRMRFEEECKYYYARRRAITQEYQTHYSNYFKRVFARLIQEIYLESLEEQFICHYISIIGI